MLHERSSLSAATHSELTVRELQERLPSWVAKLPQQPFIIYFKAFYKSMPWMPTIVRALVYGDSLMASVYVKRIDELMT